MITEQFYYIDEICKEFEREIGKSLLGKKKRNRKKKMSLSEVITICVYFHSSGYKTFKYFYHGCVLNGELRKCFPNAVSYTRFLELKRDSMIFFALMAHFLNFAGCTGVSFIDSFPLEVCHVKRASGNKTFKGSAKKGKTSVGWFYGFKLHVVINHKGQILSFIITPGNVPDNSPSVVTKLAENLLGVLIGDKGYISKKLFEELWQNGVKLVTKIRKNMKNKLVFLEEKLLLKKRGLIESVGNILKRILSVQHTRHRSKTNFLVNVFSGLIAYSFREKKPSINVPAELLN